MIDQLPPEIILQILSHLPTATATLSLCSTNKKLWEIYTTGRNAIFHTFVHKSFPSIRSTSPWQEAASRLTSRSRAWDRNAFIARECAPPRDQDENAPRNNRWQNFTYVPIIDSYETSGSDHGQGPKEVLAWGAAGRLRMRTTQSKVVKWSSFRVQDDAIAFTDILDLRLLRPHQNRNAHGESIVIRRANGNIALLNAMPEKDSFATASTYICKRDTGIECMAVSDAAEPIIIVCESKSIQLSPVHSDKQENRMDKAIPLTETSTMKQRKRCAQFMTDTRIAIATQHLEGLEQAPVEVFDVSPEGLMSQPLVRLQDFVTETSSLRGRKGANVLARVDPASAGGSDSGNLLLSGWSDGIVRLYDLRCGSEPVRNYTDAVDDGQIFSILPIGQERFLAGSHQNACLKIFDMRMNARVYDYRHLGPTLRRNEQQFETSSGRRRGPVGPCGRDINVFLALTVHRVSQPWQPLPGRHNNARLPRYRGSIYSLSSPSPSSPTVYAGIENHVIQLDFVSTDDCILKRGGAHHVLDQRPILDLSCYERPRKGYESTDTVLLRKQAEWKQCWQTRAEAETGWDERWRLERQRTRRGMAASWQTDRHN